MTVYNINKGIGWASSGVEYAQAYRASVFRELAIPTKFIFTDFFQHENIQHLTSNIGFQDDEIIWLYSFFTDIKIAPTTYSVLEFEQTLQESVKRVSEGEHFIRYRHEEKDLTITTYLRKDNPDCVQRVEYLSKDVLVRKDYFTYTKVFTEYYAPKGDQAHLYQRTFFNEDGSVAYVENADNDQKLYHFKDQIIYSTERLIGLMLERLELSSEDILILDRATGIGPAVLRHRGPSKVAVVIHAEHYNVNSTTDDYILWNNYYDYQFTNADNIDVFITSTKEQSKTLAKQFKKYTNHDPKIVTIPVGSLASLRCPEDFRHPFSLLTCSRLASEKHVDWLVRAVCLARESLPELQFDIYGSGGQEDKLRTLIESKKAGHYIRLMGHQDLTDVYQRYEVYLSASTSEGFGLTLLEAIGSGLPIIGFDVPYGNQTFVTSGKNGYLIPRSDVDDVDDYVKLFAEAIVALYKTQVLESYQQFSYQRAEEFLQDKIVARWRQFIKET